MRALRLLSPHRRPTGPTKAHDGSLQTERPDVMWATDGAQVETVREGWVWLFVAVDHHHGECVGAHVSVRGDRFSAMETVRQGVRLHFGAPSAAVARGLSVHRLLAYITLDAPDGPDVGEAMPREGFALVWPRNLPTHRYLHLRAEHYVLTCSGALQEQPGLWPSGIGQFCPRSEAPARSWSLDDCKDHCFRADWRTTGGV